LGAREGMGIVPAGRLRDSELTEMAAGGKNRLGGASRFVVHR